MKQMFCRLRFTSILLLIMAIYPSFVNAQYTDISLSDIISAVQNNVAFLREHIADFTSTEEITIEEFNNKGKITKTTKIISNYRAFPEIKQQEQPSLILPGILGEQREVLFVKENDKDKKIKEFLEPIFFSGRDGFTELFVWFDKQNEQHFDYSLDGIELVGERNTFKVKLSQNEIESGKTDDGRGSWNTRYQGVAWIDSETMQVIKLNRDRLKVVFHSRNRRATEKYFSTEYEYGKVIIKDQLLMLPIAKTVEILRDNEKLETLYKYKYSNHKAFTVDTNITYGMAD